ncbi:hypothetical protein [Bradyrhizobium sp. 76]|uniref:hypothetical protein n=1 Tax=Bradyrhizobium sp. 76 TaxID=2782680 RepID=UPI001FFB16BF|nr:hypothetical protein [Bradyrhizobium sp. 76]MCK1407664.1 hypothetical protein [Bradyrhizobium sp. 76]
MVLDARISREDLAKTLAYCHRTYLPEWTSSDVELEIARGKYLDLRSPSRPTPSRLYKMWPAKHADNLVKLGIIRLNPALYFTTVEAPAIKDEREAAFIECGIGVERIVVNASTIGRHSLLFCTTTDRSVRFEGYDSCVEVTNPEGFLSELSNALQLRSAASGANRLMQVGHSRCSYQHSRVVVGPMHGFNEHLVKLGEISWDTINILSPQKFFIKGADNQPEREYRMVFTMEFDVTGPVDLEIKKLSDYCRRLF